MGNIDGRILVGTTVGKRDGQIEGLADGDIVEGFIDGDPVEGDPVGAERQVTTGFP